MNSNRYFVRAAIALTFAAPLVSVVLPVHAQDLTTSAYLTGTVTDTSGAVIPHAKVTVSGVDNGVVRSVTTDQNGSYTVPLLPPATYRLKIDAPGFGAYQQTGITLVPDRSVKQDVQLAVGSEAQQVTVTSQAPLLNTGDANLSAEIDAKQVEDLPLNLRNVIALATLNSSVSNTSETQQLGEGGTSGRADQDVSFLNFGGGFFGTSAYLLDGVWDTDSTWGAVLYVPSVEAVQSFKIQTNSFTAQTGFSTGNVINIETKSGTRNFHGDLFEFIRNSKLDANSYFNDFYADPKLSFRRNQFGGSAGGPLYLPGIYKQRDKTFIFGVYEGLRQANPVNSTFTVPTTQMRNGDFSQLLVGAARIGNDPFGSAILQNQLFNPYTGRVLTTGVLDQKTGKVPTCPGGAHTCYYRDPFLNNNVTTAINPIGAKLLSYYPTPTGSGVTSNFFGSAAAPTTSDEYILRVDHNISDATRMYVRWADKHEQKTNSPTYYGSGDPGGPGNVRPNDRYSIVAGISHVFTATTAMSANAGFHRWNQGGLYQGYPFDQTTLGLPSSLNANSNEFPIINVGNGGASLGPVQGGFGAGIGNVGSVAVDVTKSIPKHDFSFGYMEAFLQNNGTGPANTTFSFQPDYTSQFQGTNVINGPGYGFASLLIGTPDSGSTANAFHTAPENRYIGFYVQDNWKPSRSVTLNLGLRYEWQSPFTERHNRQAHFDYNASNPLSNGLGKTLPGEEVYSTDSNRGLYSTNHTNVAPRFGFTDQFAPRLVARGGFGVFFPPQAFVGIQSSPGYSQSTNYNASNDGGLTLATTLSNPFPGGLLTPTGSSLGGLTDVGNSASTGVPAMRHSPLVYQYSLGFQYAFATNDVLTTTYVGNRGVHMLTDSVLRSQLNPALVTPANANALATLVPNPFYGKITSSSCGLDQPTILQAHLLQPYPQYCSVSESEAPNGDSYYNALLVDYNHRFHAGLNVLVSYTFSRFIDDTGGTNDWAYRGPSGAGYRDSYNLGLDRSVDGTDQTHSLVVNYIYQLPVGHKRKFLGNLGKTADAAIGGWQVSGITTVKSGLPLGISGGGNTNLYGGSQHPDEIADPILPNRTIAKWFNTAAFAAPQPYSLGNVSRYISNLRGPRYNEWDAAAEKVWELPEALSLQGRAEFYNLPNHPNFYTPDTGLNDGSFGQITQAFDSREIQFALKLLW